MSDYRVIDRPLVVIHSAWADADLLLEELGLLLWVAVHGPVSEDYIYETFPVLSEESLRKIQTLMPADLMVPPKKKRPKPKKERELTDHQIKMKHLVTLFSVKTDIPEPETNTERQRKAAGFGWFGPLSRLLKLCEGSLMDTSGLVEDTIDYMREEGLTIANPNSIVKTAIGRHAESKQSRIAF